MLYFLNARQLDYTWGKPTNTCYWAEQLMNINKLNYTSGPLVLISTTWPYSLHKFLLSSDIHFRHSSYNIRLFLPPLPAALLAEPLFLAFDCNFWGLWMELTYFMASMIIPAFTKVWIAPINQAWCNLGSIIGSSRSFQRCSTWRWLHHRDPWILQLAPWSVLHIAQVHKFQTLSRDIL